MTHEFFNMKRPHNGLTYEEYKNKWDSYLQSVNPEELSEEDRKMFEYSKLNLQRSERIEKHFTVSEELKNLVGRISNKQIWMVITENWCGDSAQCLPILYRISALNPLINFRIILRDENLDIMDLYLTNGSSRSIPILVVFDENGNELFKWGPRPKPAQDYIMELKSNGIKPPELYEKLHLWYGRDRGKSLDAEIKTLLANKV